MKIWTISNKTKVASAIFAISTGGLVASFLLLSSTVFWIFWEVVGGVLVAIGCLAEWYLISHPPEDAEKERHHKWDIYSIMAVSIGVTMEMVALFHSIPEGLRLARQVEELKTKNLELQAKLKTRIITDDERKNFIECLKGQPKGPVQLRFDRGASANVRFYAGEIANLIIAAGYSIPNGVDICDVKPILPADTSIEVWTKSLKDGPAYFFPLANCLTNVADKVVPNINADPIFFTTNELFIYVANYR